MPKRSVYIRPVDEPVWARATALAPDGLSRFLTAAIRLYLERNDPMGTTTPANGLSLVSTDVLLERCAKAAAAAALDDAARLVENARPETAARLRALAAEVRSWE